MAIYATVDKAALAAEMASWKSDNAAKAFDAAYSDYVESVTWTDGFCASMETASTSASDGFGSMNWTNAMEASMSADEKFAYGMGY